MKRLICIGLFLVLGLYAQRINYNTQIINRPVVCASGVCTFTDPVVADAATAQDQVITLGSTPPVENRVLYWESGGRVGNTSFEPADVVILDSWSFSGAGSVIALVDSPVFVTPTLGVATAAAGTGNGHVIPLSGGVPTDDHCVKFDVTGGNITITSAGAICGAGGGGFDIDGLTEETSPADLALAYIPFSNNGDDRRINIEDLFALFTTPSEWYFEDVSAVSTATATSAEHGYGVCPVSVILSTVSGSTRSYTEVFNTVTCDTGTLDATVALTNFTGRVYWVPPLIGGGVGGGGAADHFGSGDPGANGIMVRTALNTSVARSIAATTGLSVTNSDGISGNPTISYAINALTAEGSPDDAADYGIIWDASAGAHKKVLLSNWPGGGGGGGDITAVLAGTGISGGGTSGSVTINVDIATVPTYLSASPTITDWGTSDNVPANSCASKSVTFAGATVNDVVTVVAPTTFPSNLAGPFSRVTAADTVLVWVCNVTASSIALADGLTWPMNIVRSF